jgi:hypothetical protein
MEVLAVQLENNPEHFQKDSLLHVLLCISGLLHEFSDSVIWENILETLRSASINQSVSRSLFSFIVSNLKFRGNEVPAIEVCIATQAYPKQIVTGIQNWSTLLRLMENYDPNYEMQETDILRTIECYIKQ